ncbi:fibronectin type III domain-containing protein [Candidatus Dojkabacteria bacterium]|nr:fibronectin type III domain-containing protein [Candidatus Dojkabacteria bacterium]
MSKISHKNLYDWKLIVAMLVGLLIVFAGFGLILRFSQFIPLENLSITNQTSSSATLVWTTNKKAKVRVEISENSKFDNPVEFFDDRDLIEKGIWEYELVESAGRNTHHVTVKSLNPESQYYFRIFHNDLNVGLETNSFLTSKITDSIVAPDPVYGKTSKIDGSIIDDGVVLLAKKTSNESSQIVSTYLTKGSYSLDVANLLTQDLNSKFIYNEYVQNITLIGWDGKIIVSNLDIGKDEDQPVKSFALASVFVDNTIENPHIVVQSGGTCGEGKCTQSDGSCQTLAQYPENNPFGGAQCQGVGTVERYADAQGTCQYKLISCTGSNPSDTSNNNTNNNNSNNSNSNNNSTTATGCFRLEGDVEKVADGKFNVSIKFVSEGGDGDVKLEKDGAHVAGWNGWNKNEKSTFTYSSQWTGSPINVGSGQTINVTYTGTVANTSACPDIRKTLTCSFNTTNGTCGGTLAPEVNNGGNAGSGNNGSTGQVNSGDCDAGNGLIIPNNSYSCFSKTSYIRCINGIYSPTEKGTCSSCTGTSTRLADICQNASAATTDQSTGSQGAPQTLKCNDIDTTKACTDQFGVNACNKKEGEACEIKNSVSNCVYGNKCNSERKCVKDGVICTADSSTAKPDEWTRCTTGKSTCAEFCESEGKSCSNSCTSSAGGNAGITETETVNPGTYYNGSCDLANAPHPNWKQYPLTRICTDQFNVSCCCGAKNAVESCAQIEAPCEDNEHIIVKLEVGKEGTFKCADKKEYKYKCEKSGSNPVLISNGDSSATGFCKTTRICTDGENIFVVLKQGSEESYKCADNTELKYKCEKAGENPVKVEGPQAESRVDVPTQEENQQSPKVTEFKFNKPSVDLYSCPKQVSTSKLTTIDKADIQTYGLGLILKKSENNDMYLVNIEGKKGWVIVSDTVGVPDNLVRGTSKYCYDLNGKEIGEIGVLPRVPSTGTGGFLRVAQEDVLNPSIASEGGVIDPGKYTVEGIDITTKELEFESEGVISYFQDLNGDGLRQENEPLFNGDVESLNIKFNKISEAQTYQIEFGWNLVSFPLYLRGEDTSNISKASELLAKLNAEGINSTHLVTYRAGKFIVFSTRAGESEGGDYGDDFSVLPGEGYFIKSYASGLLVLNGKKIENSQQIAVENGWNLVGIYNSNKLSYRGFEILKQANSTGVEVDLLSKWENGIYYNLVLENGKEYGNDYNIYPYQGYFLRVNNKGVGTFTPN